MTYVLSFRGHAHLGLPMLRCDCCGEDRPALIADRRWTCPTCKVTHLVPWGLPCLK